MSSGRMVELWDLEDVARHFKVTKRTIRNWMKWGAIPSPAVRMGRKIYWRRRQIEAMSGYPGETQKARD